MYIRKTLITSAIALALASTSAVMAQKAPFADLAPIDEMPMIETAPDGLFIGAPIVHNMNTMIVQVFNNQNEMVLNVRSKGEPVELLAAGLPDGEYSYQVKTIYQLDMPTGQGADYSNEGSSREAGSFTIKDATLVDDAPGEMSGAPASQEDASVLDRVIKHSMSLAGVVLDVLVPSAQAANVTVSSTEPLILFDDTSLAGDEWNIWGNTARWGVADVLGTSNHWVIRLDGSPGSNLNADSMIVDADGDIHWAQNSMYLDKSTSELSLGTTFTPAALNLWDTSPDIRFHDETDTAEAELELNGGFFRLWARTTDLLGFTIPFAVHVDAPTDSLLIQSNGHIRMQNNIHFNTGTTPTMNIGGTGTTSDTLVLEGNSPELRIMNSTHGVELEGYGSQGFIVNMDNNGDGNSNTFNVFGIANAAPQNSLRIDASGNAGLGTDTPSEAVDVQRSGAASRFQLTSFTDTASQAAQFIQRRAHGTAGAPTALLNNDNIGLMSFRGWNGTNFTGSKAAIAVSAKGTWSTSSNGTQIAFNTTPIGSTSMVNVMTITQDGLVKVNGTTLNVPDYVFEDDYELMSLDQLDAYITEHKHLPGVASAKEVNEGGLDLAGSQMSVLEKVEELTLYTLQQHRELKQMEALKAENAQLKASHRQLLSAFHAQQEKLDTVDQLEQMVNQLIQSQEGKSVYTSLK